MKTEWIDNNEQCTMNNVQWEKVKFVDFFDMLPTNTLSRDKLNNQRGEYQNIHYGDVLIKYPYCLDCNNNDIPYINDGVRFNNVQIKDGDVIFADTAEDDTVGKCVEVLNVGDRKIVAGLHTYFCRPKFKIAFGYMGYYLNSNHFHNQLLPFIAGSKVSSVNKASISRTYIFYPPSLTVQRRIAAILSSADKVIASTQKVIDKLKQIKQGMMDDLLKPKDGWRMVKLGEVYNFQYGDGNKNPNNNGDYPIYGANGIIGGYTKFNAVDSVVIGHMGEYAGSVIWANGKHFVTYNGTITIVKDNNSLYDRFGYFVLLNLDIKKICAGSGQPFLSYDTLNKIEISIPDLAEQSRIASILSGIDSKIAAEEKVLEKYKAVKKGLMEKLLNGK